MKSIFAVLLCLVFFIGCDAAKTDSTPISHAIVNGTPTGYLSWQSVVMVRTSTLLCTGTLIHEAVVLTAAHCIYSKDLFNDDRNQAEMIEITGGEAGDEFLAHVSEIDIHPAWTGIIANDASDLALLHLAEPISDISPVSLRDYPSPSVGDDALIVGYGDDPSDTRTAPLHRQGRTAILQISPYFIEIGGESNTCSGDSGGPLFTRQKEEWMLTGVTSYGADDCIASSEGYSVNLLSYCGWLNDTLTTFVGEDLGLENCTGCEATSTASWGQPCGPGYPCCSNGTQCRTPDAFSSGSLGYCAPGCCNLGQPDVGYCTNVTSGEEQCLFTAEFESAYCAIGCDDDDDCVDGTVCKNRPFASDKICIAETAGSGPDCGGEPDDTDGGDSSGTDSSGTDDISETGGKSGCGVAPPRPGIATVLFHLLLG